MYICKGNQTNPKTRKSMETTTKLRQKAKVGVAGSFMNQLMANNSTLPKVGKGATKLHYSDRSCYEVIEVSEDYKTVKLESLDAEWDKTKEGGQGHQNWILKPTGRFLTVTWRNDAWRVKNEQVLITDDYYKSYEERQLEVGHKQAHAEMIQPLLNENGDFFTFIEGKTKIKTSWNKIPLLFGVKDYYYDWSF